MVMGRFAVGSEGACVCVYVLKRKVALPMGLMVFDARSKWAPMI